MQSVIVHYPEIALKGKNRPWFVARLVRNLRTATADLDVRSVRALMGRIEMELGPGAEWEVVRARLSRVFGVGNFAKAGRAPLEIEAMAAAILGPPRGFPVRDVSGLGPPCGQAIPADVAGARARGGRTDRGARGLDVNLGHPELTIHLEALTDEAFYFFGKEGRRRSPGRGKRQGGLPAVGRHQSPVAAWRMMRRGCRVEFVHFHSYPVLSRASQEKAASWWRR